jgi:hypothetical protein
LKALLYKKAEIKAVGVYISWKNYINYELDVKESTLSYVHRELRAQVDFTSRARRVCGNASKWLAG